MVELSLAEYRKQLAIQRLAGAELERERIIKLLEFEYERGDYEMGIVPYLIEAVKGEPDA